MKLAKRAPSVYNPAFAVASGVLMKIHLSRPDITEAEIEAVCDVLRGPNLALGPKKKKNKKAMAIGPGDEVITTPFTFVATSNCIIMAGAKPVFVDIDPVSLNIDANKIAAAITENTKAILPVEVFGSCAGFDKISELAAKHKTAIIEDSCEALGSVLNGTMAGGFGQMSVLAFYPNKQMTTGEGGMILTDDDKLADLCTSLRNQGRGNGQAWLGHERLGYNFRLSDINATLGLVQLSRIEEIKAKRSRVAKWYQEALSGDDRLIVPKAPADCDMSWFVFVVRLAEEFSCQQRDAVLAAMRKAEIGVSNYFPPVHLQPFMVERYGYKQGDFPITEAVSERTIALPFYNNLGPDEVEIVCETLKRCIDKL